MRVGVRCGEGLYRQGDFSIAISCNMEDVDTVIHPELQPPRELLKMLTQTLHAKATHWLMPNADEPTRQRLNSLDDTACHSLAAFDRPAQTDVAGCICTGPEMGFGQQNTPPTVHLQGLRASSRSQWGAFSDLPAIWQHYQRPLRVARQYSGTAGKSWYTSCLPNNDSLAQNRPADLLISS